VPFVSTGQLSLLLVRRAGDATIATHALIVLLIVVALPIAWLASEFGERRPLRIALGVAAIASAMGVAYIVGHLSRWNYNAWYGYASKELIDTMVTEVEDGNVDRVMSILRRLNLDYQPTYENRAHYDELVNEAVSQMKGDDACKAQSGRRRRLHAKHGSDTGKTTLDSGSSSITSSISISFDPATTCQI
jgi:hypothetical protein